MNCVCSKDLCTGCLACVHTCTKKAISVCVDKLGFSYPSVDEKKCVECGACKRVCHVCSPGLKKEPLNLYTYKASESERLRSSSGAFFPLIAKFFLGKGYYICGVVFEDDYLGVKYILTRSEEDIGRMRKSKYVDAKLGNVFAEIQSLIASGEKAFFVGLPCHVAALLKLVKTRDRLFTVDLICYGSGSPYLYQKSMPILYSCHPRSRKRLEVSGLKLDPRVIRHEPLGFHDYNCLQMNAFAVVSDSGTLPEESSFFMSVGHPFPAVCIRTSTERPEALDKACFILSGIDEKGLLRSVDTAVEMNRNGDYGIPVPDYIEENVSSKVVKIIQSYTGVVNKMVWRKF